MEQKINAISKELKSSIERVKSLNRVIEAQTMDINALLSDRKSTALHGIAIYVNSALLILMTLFLVLRLGPFGYSSADAQADRTRLCDSLTARFPQKSFHCPPITGKGAWIN